MKKTALVLLLLVLISPAISEAEPIVSIVKTIQDPAIDGKHFDRAGTQTVLKIADKDNNVLCYSVISSAQGGKASDGGYPMNSISCLHLGISNNHLPK